jgi:hypothetical protein
VTQESCFFTSLRLQRLPRRGSSQKWLANIPFTSSLRSPLDFRTSSLYPPFTFSSRTYRREQQSATMPPKRGMKRVISDEEDDDFAPAAETAENPEESTRPARKTRKTIASKATAPTQDSDAEEPDEITQPARKTRKTAAPTPRDNSEQTSRQRASKTGLHAPAQNPDLGPRQSTNKAARQVSTTSKRSLSNQSSAKRGTTYQEVFAKTSLTNIERQKNWIKELIMARRRERTGNLPPPKPRLSVSQRLLLPTLPMYLFHQTSFA